MKWWHFALIGIGGLVVYKLWKHEPVPLVGSLFDPKGATTPPAAPAGSGVEGAIKLAKDKLGGTLG